MQLLLPLALRSWLLLFSKSLLLSFWQFANNILVGLYLLIPYCIFFTSLYYTSFMSLGSTLGL
jgi:uncharacterized membrane protein (GlpM family)